MIVQDAALVIVTLDPGESLVDAFAELPPGTIVEGTLVLTHIALHDGRTFDRAEVLSLRATVSAAGVEVRAALLADELATGEISFARTERRVSLRATVPRAEKPRAEPAPPERRSKSEPTDPGPADIAEPEDAHDPDPEPAAPAAAPGGDVGWGDLASLSAEQTKDDLAARALEELAKEEARKRAEAERAGAAPAFLDDRRKKKKLARKKAALKSTVPLFEKQPLPKSRKKAVPIEAVDLDVPYPDVDDLLDHRQFGLCKVLRIDEEGAVRVELLRNGKIKQLHLDVFEVSAPRTDEEGQRIFTLRPRKKRR